MRILIYKKRKSLHLKIFVLYTSRIMKKLKRKEIESKYTVQIKNIYYRNTKNFSTVENSF